MELLLNQQTKHQLSSFIKAPSHSVLINGSKNSGKAAIASYLAAALLGIQIQALGKARVLNIKPKNNAISIEEVRAAQQFMKLTTMGQKPIRRILIVEEAESLTLEAQNAFLKLLEEPPPDTVVILTASNKAQLLPTIRSRVQIIEVKPLGKRELLAHFIKLGFKKDAVEKVYYMSDGRIGLMTALLHGDDSKLLVENIDIAKQVLAQPAYNRLALVNKIAKEKTDVANFIDALGLICHAGLLKAVETENFDLARKWHKSLKSVAQAQGNLPYNPNLKLLLSDLLLNL